MPTSPISLNTLRRYAVARSLFAPTKLAAAIERLGFVQADPIRAPARAQELVLRHRVKGYLAGDLKRRYGSLEVEEEFFVNYGFLPRKTYALLHPRRPRSAWSMEREAQAEAVLSFVQERGVVHPREVDSHFAHGRVRKGLADWGVFWGGRAGKGLGNRLLLTFQFLRKFSLAVHLSFSARTTSNLMKGWVGTDLLPKFTMAILVNPD